jgi:hypothetical protein
VNVRVVLRRVSTGEEVTIENEAAWLGPPERESLEFWWTEGNGGCDCNRSLYFERAKGVGEGGLTDHPCGNEAFALTVLEADGVDLLVGDHVDRRHECVDCGTAPAPMIVLGTDAHRCMDCSDRRFSAPTGAT